VGREVRKRVRHGAAQLRCPIEIEHPVWNTSNTCGNALRTDEQVAAGRCGRHLLAQRRKDEAERRRAAAEAELERSRQAATEHAEQLRGLGLSAEAVLLPAPKIRGGVAVWSVMMTEDSWSRLVPALTAYWKAGEDGSEPVWLTPAQQGWLVNRLECLDGEMGPAIVAKLEAT
jgi:hypothetical protein